MRPGAEKLRRLNALATQATRYRQKAQTSQNPREKEGAEAFYLGALSEIHDTLHSLQQDGTMELLLSFLETWRHDT